MAFSLHDFSLDTLTRMINGGEPDYQVMQLALRWYEKGVLVDTDMEAIAALIAEREAAREAAEQTSVDASEELPVDEAVAEDMTERTTEAAE